MSTTPVMVIGLDSMDKDLVFQWSREGLLPAFEQLIDSSINGQIENPKGLEAGACWPSFCRGSSPARNGQYDGARFFDPTTYRDNFYHPGEDNGTPIWRILGSGGKKCIVIDAPYALLKEEENCTFVVDRAAHVPAEGGEMMRFRTSPSDLAEKIEQRYGPDPAGGVSSDHFPLNTAAELERFVEIYCQRIALKGQMIVDMMREFDWDFFFPVFTEAHCFGHRCWHLHDPTHPAHRPDLASAVRDPLLQGYQAIDQAVGQILAAAGDTMKVIVYLSHGMGPRRSGTHLLDRVLVSLEGGRLHTRDSPGMQALRRLWRKLPPGFKSSLSPLRKSITNDGFQLGRSRRRFFEIYANDRTAGIRLNVKGREKSGTVSPGAEYDELCDWLTAELRKLVNVGSGEPLVAEVIKTKDTYEGPLIERLPDLLVTWNRSAPITSARSDTVGLIDDRGLYTPRFGDHRPVGYFFATGADWEPRRLNETIPVIDFAPTIARLFGVSEAWSEGQSISYLQP